MLIRKLDAADKFPHCRLASHSSHPFSLSFVVEFSLVCNRGNWKLRPVLFKICDVVPSPADLLLLLGRLMLDLCFALRQAAIRRAPDTLRRGVVVVKKDNLPFVGYALLRLIDELIVNIDLRVAFRPVSVRPETCTGAAELEASLHDFFGIEHTGARNRRTHKIN